MPKLEINLKLLRKETRGYRREVEKKLGIVESTLIRKLGGTRPLSLDELNKICEVIRRNPSDYISQEDS